MRTLSRKTAKQTCENRLGSVCASETVAIQKNKNIFNSLAAVIHKMNVMRPAIAKRLCTHGLTEQRDRARTVKKD